MVIYSVEWHLEPGAASSRIPLNASVIRFSCLVRNSSDALKCLDYAFRENILHYKYGVSVDDGSVQLKRQKIDSRGFYPQYLLLDGIKEPLYLSDMSSNIHRLHKIWQ